jgi:succinoglycan biosynthesis protein ExoA
MTLADFSHVLIVVPCLNEAPNLPALLKKFCSDSPGALIVVVDGGSSDDSRGIVQDFSDRYDSVRLLDNPKRVQSAGINLAVRNYGQKREWLVRVDAHCVYPDDFVETLIDAAREHRAESVVVPMITKGMACFQTAVAAAQNSVLGTGGAAHRHVGKGRYVDHGHHALLRLDRFYCAGGYDEDFSHNEDAELDQRLLKLGTRLWLEPRGAVIYSPRETPQRLYRQYFNHGGGRARTVLKHRLKLKIRQRLPLMILPMVCLASIGAAGTIYNGNFIMLAIPVLAWAVLCLGYGLALALRARSWCTVAAGGAAAIMHLAWSAGYWNRTFMPRPSTEKAP